MPEEREHATQAGAEANEAGQEKYYSEEDVKKLLQKEGDRRVASALEKQEAKWKSLLDEARKEAEKEGERRAKLSKEEARAEKDAQERQAFLEEKARFLEEKRTHEAEKKLLQEGIPTDFAPYLIGADAEETEERVSLFARRFHEAVQQALEEKLKTTAPKASPLGSVSKEEIAKEKDPLKRLDMIRNNLNLYQ